MRALEPAVSIHLWELGADQLPVQRCVTMLAEARGARPEVIARIPLGVRDAGLLELWERWYGADIPCVDVCPFCSETLEFTVCASDLRATARGPDDQDAEPRVVGRLLLRSLTSEDVLAVGLGARAEERLARRALVQVDGSPWAGSLDQELYLELEAALAHMDPLAEILLDLACAACGRPWRALFDIGEHLWHAVSRDALEALYAVDALARAYGWDEARILGLSPRRRRTYLDLVGA